jgi:hypothetical protein
LFDDRAHAHADKGPTGQLCRAAVGQALNAGRWSETPAELPVEFVLGLATPQA